MVPTRRRRQAILYCLPALGLAGVWVYGPLLATAVLSLFDWNLTTRSPRFVGTENYRAIAGEAAFSDALVTTVVTVAAIAVLVVAVPLAVSVLVWKRGGRLTGLYRALFFLPVLIPPAVGAVLWEWILHPILGVANHALGWFGIAPVNWLNRPATALGAVVAVTGWKAFGLSFILFTAGLTTIDGELLDAARMDGAHEHQLTRHVVLPLLRPTTIVVTFTAVVFAAQWAFTAIDVLTGGGPAGATTNLFYLQYQHAFDFADGGGAAALAVGLVLVFGAIATLQLKLRRDTS